MAPAAPAPLETLAQKSQGKEDERRRESVRCLWRIFGRIWERHRMPPSSVKVLRALRALAACRSSP